MKLKPATRIHGIQHISTQHSNTTSRVDQKKHASPKKRPDQPTVTNVTLTDVVVGLSICISTTSPSMISVSSLKTHRKWLHGQVPKTQSHITTLTHFILTPIDLRKACVRASVLLISREKISLPAMDVNGVSAPRACAMPIAMAVFPVPGWPPINTARPAILPSCEIKGTRQVPQDGFLNMWFNDC